MAEKNDLAVERSAEPVRTQASQYFAPRVDIMETDKEWLLSADMPGVKPEDVDLRYERGELTVHGRIAQRRRPDNLLLGEYDEGDFRRAFQVNEAIDASRIEAECKNGVLTIRLPKEEAVQPKKIVVR
jgi:HSP20 family protein